MKSIPTAARSSAAPCCRLIRPTIVEITGNNVKMTRPIEDLVFYEK
jgi:hypothetical protein